MNEQTATDTFSYVMRDAQGVTSSANVTVIVTGKGEPIPLFTTGNDTVDFNTIAPGQYQPSDYYAGYGGNDRVTLPGSTTQAAAIGYAAGNEFDAGQGDDIVNGGALNDTIRGGQGRDTLFGGAGDDTLIGGFDFDTLRGGAGNDVLNSGESVRADIASYYLASAAVTVDLALQGVAQDTRGDGIDTLINILQVSGSNYDDTLFGAEDRDLLWGNAGADTLIGRGGDDTLGGDDGDMGADHMDGGAGMDTVDYFYAGGGVTVDLGIQGVAQNTGGGGIDTLISIERVFGSSFGDVLTSSSQGNQLSGFDGNDTLIGLGGNDTLFTGSGDDLAQGGAGNDNLYGDIGNDRLFGGNGDDQAYGGSGDDSLFGDDGNDILSGDLGNDVLNGGTGNDVAAYFSAQTSLTIDLRLQGVAQDTGGAGIDTLISIETIFGSSTAGNILIGDDGDNYLQGGSGDDTIEGGLGNDRLFGGDGNDTVSFAHAANGVSVMLPSPPPPPASYSGVVMDTHVGEDTMTSFENVIGSDFDDRFQGGTGSNVFQSGKGNDELTGYGGADRFVFNDGDGQDIITDFFIDPASVIDLRGVAGLESFADLQAHLSQLDTTAVITLNGTDRIELHNVQASTLVADDFLL